MIDEKDRTSFASTLSASQQHMTPWQWEGRLSRKNQNLGWFRIAALPRRQENSSILWNGLLTDITDMKLAEQELNLHREHLEELVAERTHELAIARDEALQATRVKNTFLDKMSYELRTPLNSIIGFTTLIRDGQAGAINKEQKLQLDMINDSASSLLLLINDILDIASIEKRSAVTNREHFDFQSLLETVTGAVRTEIEAKGLKLDVESSSDSQMIYSDSEKLKQILHHLIDNSIKFTESGTITIRSMLNDLELVVEVIDTGMGIPADKLNHVFDIFTTQDEGHDLRRQGTGLGLSICKRFTELLGGRLDVHSTPGQGTVVTVHLPARPGTTTKPVSGPSQPAHISKVFTILAVDSDPEFLELMQAYLQNSFEIITCRNANDAVFMARRFKPALITIDILMPYVDGWTILTELKTDEATRDIPVVVISTYDDKGKSQMLGAAAVLKKPLSRDKLLNTLHSITEHQQQTRRLN